MVASQDQRVTIQSIEKFDARRVGSVHSDVIPQHLFPSIETLALIKSSVEGITAFNITATWPEYENEQLQV